MFSVGWQIELLGREARDLDRESVGCWLDHRVVMITGAGGTIGSELARLCASFSPRQIVLIDRNENALFNIDAELSYAPQTSVLCDATDRELVGELIDEYRPDIVLHCAAHKHVPMLESNVRAAVRNNFEGTVTVADAARRCGAGWFVLVSTDKAANPISVMGKTKALAEDYIRELAEKESPFGHTAFCSVRFGNVAGSSGSVLETWEKQLEAGRPLTVTDPDMTRYFMSVEEAAGLVLQAGAIAKGGETFVLDMGEPLRIGELAERMAGPAGVEIIGPRCGERRHETLVSDNERLAATDIEGVSQVVR